MELVEQKKRLRAEMLRRRAKMVRPGAGAQAAANLFRHVLRPGEVVAAFWSIGVELDTAALRDSLVARGHVVLMPRVAGRDRPLEFRRWRPGDDTRPGPFGIAEPLASAPEMVPDLIVAPLLAVDRRGYRLGYGGGYYDRTIAASPAARTVGWGYQGQVIDAVPSGPDDRRVQAVVTEAGWFATEGE